MDRYPSFVVFALVLSLAPGPDSLLTLRSTVIGGRGRGLWTAGGIVAGVLVQAVLAAAGVGAVIAAARPVFESIRWLGVAYLVWLGIQALRSARRADPDGWTVTPGARPRRWAALRQGFLSDVTNPKVLAFNLAVLPQFVGTSAGIPVLLAYTLTLTAFVALVLAATVLCADAVKRAITSRRVRRGIDTAAGVAFLGFAGALAAEG